MIDKPKLTREELSRIRSQAAQKGIAARKAVGYANVGRKKGYTKDPSLKGVPSRSMTVRDPDYNVFVRCANAMDVPLIEFMHLNAEGLKKRNPMLFSRDVPPIAP